MLPSLSYLSESSLIAFFTDLCYSFLMSEFKIFHYPIKTRKLSCGTELTFVLLADLHNHSYGRGNARLLEAIKAQKPDAVLVAGDMLVAAPGVSFEPALTFMQKLREAGFPVYYGNGNHEYRMRVYPETYGSMYEDYTGALKECGVCLLENQSVSLTKGRDRLTIYGYELDRKYYQKLHQEPFVPEELKKALGEPDSKTYNILLAHNPVYFEDYARWGADLTLSGHLHGGIIRIPGIGGLITPQARLFPKYDAGYFQREGKSLVVSRGLGTHTVNLRIFNPAELAVIHLGYEERKNGNSSKITGI